MKFPYRQFQTNFYCPDKGGFTVSNMFDIQICNDKLNFGAYYQRNGYLISNLYKNVARLMEVSGTWRSGCWRFDCNAMKYQYKNFWYNHTSINL